MFEMLPHAVKADFTCYNICIVAIVGIITVMTLVI